LDAFEFVNSLDSNKHVLQLITDDTKAKNTQFQFLNNGLLQDEYCVYLTHENPEKIKKKMQEFGIDVAKYTEKGLLHVYKVPNIMDHPAGSLAGFEEFFNSIMPNPCPKFRLVGRPIDDVSSEKSWQAYYEIEQFVHSNFDKYNGSVMCYCEYQKLGDREDMSRMTRLLDCHTSAIFSTLTESNYGYDLHHRNKRQ